MIIKFEHVVFLTHFNSCGAKASPKYPPYIELFSNAKQKRVLLGSGYFSFESVIRCYGKSYFVLYKKAK